MELQLYKVETTEQSICTANIGGKTTGTYKNGCNEVWSYNFAIVLAMNKGIDCWVSFSFTHPSSLHLKAKFMKKN